MSLQGFGEPRTIRNTKHHKVIVTEDIRDFARPSGPGGHRSSWSGVHEPWVTSWFLPWADLSHVQSQPYDQLKAMRLLLYRYACIATLSPAFQESVGWADACLAS
ncbi:unnamed protein product [Haemonchus placei]|uniref:Transposase n=1 Tax=Haemonchus placei TaxID=6290 RepID=A0A0N4WMA4_HAEPC|nr:unnamed protein product [Haemonchus placei]